MIVTPSRVDCLDGLDQRLAFGVGQTACDLVQKQQLGMGRHGAGQFQALAFKQRQPPRRRVGFRNQFGALKDDGACVSDLCFAFVASECARHQQVLVDRQLGKGLRDLKRPADA
jgi:hypothetical protein